MSVMANETNRLVAGSSWKWSERSDPSLKSIRWRKFYNLL